ncbi:MAG: preprotein translocase subunit SecY [Elusimicrobia bacterium RIFOXYA2_FULL_39_19]|nr:MAG: preprotein translocase subunit SecY [Elusimicrobia bacterium RIFOXYA2_FULL_39_19]
MLRTFTDIFKVPELKRKILFTLGIIAAYRLGAAVPISGVNPEALKALFDAHKNSLLGFMDMFSGGAMSKLSVFSLGIMPYINASIIMSLLQGMHVIPFIDRLAKEGESGRKKISQITRYATVVLSIVQGFGLTIAISKMPVPGNMTIVENPTMGFYILTVITLVTGTMLVMWLGEQITQFGIGNGISLMIFAGIVDRLPGAIKDFYNLFRMQEISLITSVLLLFLVLLVTGVVIWVETAQRKIPVQYAKRIVGRKMVGGASTFLPLKVDQAGVIAVIFAISVLSAPLTLMQFLQNYPLAQNIMSFWQRGSWLYELIYALLIVFFCYFYNSIIINPNDMAENMKKWGGFIPGIRPGEATAKHIQKIIERITLGGALFVVAIAIMPDLLRSMFNAPFFFGGTALLIVVGVSLDTIGQIESQMIMRHYEGFMKNGRIKGRWFNIK